MKSNSDAYDVLVIGGGPAGMMAAVTAAQRGKRVVLLEKNVELGRKLNITGGGRCNITNFETDNKKLLIHYGQSAQALFSPFSQHAVLDTWAFFSNEGLQLKEEGRRRVFPITNRASDVTDALRMLLNRYEVKVILGCAVQEILRENDSITGVKTNKGEFAARSYILATGGLSRPETGSTGDGFKWLRELGHTVVAPTPSIVPLEVKEHWVQRIAGKTAPDARVSFWVDGKKQFAVNGRILFTHFGLSGPTILNSASRVGELLEAGEVLATIDLFPSMDQGAVEKQLLELFAANQNKALKTVMKDFLPNGLSMLLPEVLPEIDFDGKVHSFSKGLRKKLLRTIKALPLTVTRLMGFDRAVVADGGVDLKEVDTRTMQSRLYPNLYIVGDLLHINRPSGGYSLQLCWTTGCVAGISAAI